MRPPRSLSTRCNKLHKSAVDFQLTNAAGDGVPGEIAFSAADAGVLNLIGYRLPDPFDTFYGPRPLGVTTAETRGALVEQRSYGQKAEDVGGGGTETKSEVREDFRPLAHWAPAIRTDDDGEASVTFELPQSSHTVELRTPQGGPTIDDASLEPNQTSESFNGSETINFKANVSDPDLPNDEVNMSLYIEGEYEGSDYLQSNGTATARPAVRTTPPAASPHHVST